MSNTTTNVNERAHDAPADPRAQPARQPARANLMLMLRAQTAEEHRRLEAALDLMRDDMALGDYACVLRALYGFIAPWEEAAHARLPASLVAAFDARRKTGALRDDLRTLARMGAGESDVRGLSLPTFESTAAWLGSWYVIEGSTLGGQILAPHFAARFGFSAQGGMRYFSGYGPRTASMWNAFRALLVETIEPAAYATAVDGARRTFLRLHQWMIETGVARGDVHAETTEGAG
ncbi:MAG TPA: biliverdin-producing heme oxygenase [Pararobbsia sp.]|nr:biliverdin-producing heme oxygenase [Pararobbsia sp.]